MDKTGQLHRRICPTLDSICPAGFPQRYPATLDSGPLVVALLSLLGHRGPTTYHRRCLPALPSQGLLPETMLPDLQMVRFSRTSYLPTILVSRHALWMLLRRLLLGRHAGALWAWHEQPAVHGRCNRGHRGGKDRAAPS